MASMANVQLNHIPYRSTGQAVLDLSEGRIDITFGLLGSNLPLMREGKIRALAVTTAKRTKDVPDVPTMAEAGLPGFEASLWFAMVGPAALPPAIVDRLNREVNAILNDPEVRNALTAQATQVELSTPENIRELIRADIAKWKRVADKLGIKPE
jgi:tripartite-type tricarboxylate transporter receptor subunit TctC